ncbi:hypothetical protein PTTG_27501 [Puccinia triticina 1-1 BBBD Race 1]|uniref:Secreted protein n=2 Tax=Puccinia triticina TaxID=208348 RepID=A0A180GK62_PUCT1|nr:uncharacterized protein PtA15_14A299 [Puccinia triticina]OAV92839.1 hypothetical protein PTTG_27501 [Puccinia triticina 1-1 BBBD Race 1]WAQ91415.1 hypothetical protein PtA15_14A299 [Puccinia triticina]
MVFLALALVAVSGAANDPLVCAACGEPTAVELADVHFAPCGRVLPNGEKCEEKMKKRFFRCTRPACKQLTRFNEQFMSFCRHLVKEHIEGPLDNPTILKVAKRAPPQKHIPLPFEIPPIEKDVGEGSRKKKKSRTK